MKSSTVDSEKGAITLVEELATPLKTGAELLELLMNHASETLALRAQDLVEAFFDLRTGIAGDMLQKVSTYRKRLIILGDFSDLKSRSLHDFIFESNRAGRVIFSETLESAIDQLK